MIDVGLERELREQRRDDVEMSFSRIAIRPHSLLISLRPLACHGHPAFV
jgi:hypothetical protein